MGATDNMKVGLDTNILLVATKGSSQLYKKIARLTYN
jgi:hypothetical protein